MVTTQPGEAAAPSHKSREVRLGLVMYGGISLAIYIYGVAQEFFNAVRGRGIFRLIKALTDSDVVVDIISGTSAGGINGILLAYCLCNKKEFSGAASTWRENGDIGNLLRDPWQRRPPKSVLKGDDYFLTELQKAFKRLDDCPADPTEDVSDVHELDLFVTGTDVHGNVYTWFDAAGHPVEVKDHRDVFCLQHRSGRKQQFTPDFHPQGTPAPDPEKTFEALAKLARVTSSFPGAFEPVLIDIAEPDDATVDGKLRFWGQLGTERNAVLVDGGVLDNKPFTYTIRQIFYRLADREVARHLCYVEPDPEQFPHVRHVDEPNVFSVALRSLMGIPGYESIADDLRLLTEHNARIERFRRLAGDLADKPPQLTADTTAFIRRMERRERGEPAEESTEESALRPCPYAQSRLVEISERVVQGVLRINGQNQKLSVDETRAATDLIRKFDAWPGSGDQTLSHFDVYFRMRRLMHVLYACPPPLLGSRVKDTSEGQALHGIGRQIRLIEILRAAMERLVDEARFPWKNPETVWPQVEAAFKHLLNCTDAETSILPAGYNDTWKQEPPPPDTWLPQTTLTAVNTLLAKRTAEIKGRVAAGTLAPPAQFESVLQYTDATERRMLSLLHPQPMERPPLAHYEQFMALDAQLFPIEALAELHEKDVIKTVRISPLDARKGFSDRSAANKVSGDAFYHFGGFFKRSWRSNDILWGRLDGLCQLVETLLDPLRVLRVVENEVLRKDLRARLQGDLAPKLLFPHSPEATHAEIEAWLRLVTADSGESRAQVLPINVPQSDRTSPWADDAVPQWEDDAAQQRFEDGVKLLIEAAQLEVLHREVSTVVSDALTQQAEWNQFRFRGRVPREAQGTSIRYDVENGTFYQRGEGDVDPLVMTVATGELARQGVVQIQDSTNAAAARRPKDTPLGKFFTEKYRVGSESLAKDIPPLVLIELLAKTLLVVRNCVVAAFPPHAETIRKSPLYKAVSGALLTFYAFTVLLKQPSARQKAVHMGLAVVAFVILTLGIFYPKGPLDTRWVVVFILGPIAILTAQAWFLYRFVWPEAPRLQHPFEKLPKGCLGWLVIVTLVLTLVAAAATDCAGPQSGPRVTDLELARTTDQVRSVVLDWNNDTALARSSLYFDFLLLLAYANMLALACVWVAERLRAAGSPLAALGALMAWGAWLAGTFDCFENVLLLRLLSAIDRNDLSSVCPWERSLAPLCTRGKWIFLGIVVVYVTSAILVAWRARRPPFERNPQTTIAHAGAPHV